MQKKFVFGLTVLILLTVAAALYLWSPWQRGPTPSKPAPQIDRSRVIEQFQRRGENLFKMRRLRTFIATYKTVLAAAPDSAATKKKLADAHYQLGLIEQEEGNIDNARKNFEEAARLKGETE